MKWSSLVLLCCYLFISGCSSTQSKHNALGSTQQSNGLERLAKSDIDEVIELHQLIMFGHLKKLMIKLYKRNPQHRHDKTQRTIEQSVERVFQSPSDYDFPEWQGKTSTDLIRLAMSDEFTGKDRVLPFILGLYTMILTSYDNHKEFYYLTSIDGQKLYNSARNIEIAAWLLSSKKDAAGKLILLSDSLAENEPNLSFQRLIGEMTATQDNLAAIVAQKTGRVIKSVVQRAASMAFLPI